MKLTLTGTHCSGKTSLIKSLSGLHQFKEYQFFTERTGFLKNELNVKLNEDSELISQYIFTGERAKELFSGPNIFSDRSIYDVCSYTLGAKSINNFDKKTMVEGCVPLMKEYDVVIYVSPEGVEIEDNGLRSVDPDYRNKVDKVINMMLMEYPPKRLIRVSGTTEQRIETILAELGL